MSVPESERGGGKFDVLIKADDLAIYTIRICSNQNVFLPEYQTALTNDIITTAKNIFMKCWTANNIRINGDVKRFGRRLELQEEAIEDCNSLLALIRLSKSLYHLSGKRVKYWGEKTINVRNSIMGWREGEWRRNRHLMEEVS